MNGKPRIDALCIEWFCAHADDEYARLERFLVCLRDWMPGALPVRYDTDRGTEEFEWSERMLFRDAARTGSVHWASKPPFFQGFIVGVRSPLQRRSPPLIAVQISLNAWAMADDAVRDEVCSAVSKIGSALQSFYALGWYEHNLYLVNGQLAGGLGSSSDVGQIMGPACWIGLPWKGPTFEWFGAEYVPLLGEPALMRGIEADGAVFLAYRSPEDRSAILPEGLLQSAEGRPAAVAPTGLRWSP